MKDYLLFIDTEASGLPKDWDAPYSKEKNWPFAVQVSWIVFSKEGNEVKRVDYYVKNNDFVIAPSAIKVHGITRDNLNKKGVDRKKILRALVRDLEVFEPLVVGHFIELDYHVLSAEFYRAGMSNPMKDLKFFCTMLVTKGYHLNPTVTYLKLFDLFESLFNTPLHIQHNAMADASATAACFFELLKHGDINDETINEQVLHFKTPKAAKAKSGCSFSLLLISLTVLMSFLL